MEDKQFADLVRRACVILQYEDDITPVFIDEDLSDEDKFLITAAAKQLTEALTKPIDLDTIKVHRGSCVSKEHGHILVKDSITGEC